VISPPTLAGSSAFDKWLADRVGTARLRIEVAPDDPVALRRLLGELDCRLLAVEAGIGEGRMDRLRDLAERFACDLLIVR
jgi:hypothetical protein